MIKCSGNHYQLIERLKSLGKDFETRLTTKSASVIFDGYKYLFADNHFSNRYLRLFQQLKKEVHSNIEQKKIVVPEISKSKYFEIGRFQTIAPGEFLTFDNCIEFDINKAYYHALLLLGYISEEFYKVCVELPKNIRLALVGTLATQKTIFYYSKGEIESYKIVSDDILRRVFFQLVDYIDTALDLFGKMASDQFLFYWVDGIYLKNYDRAEYHRAVIEYEFNLQFSAEPMKQIMVYNKSEYCTQITVENFLTELRTFTVNNVFLNSEKLNQNEN